MYKSLRTGELFNSNTVNYLNFIRNNKNTSNEKAYQQQTRPIIIQETCESNNSKNLKNSNLPFNYENVINNYKKILDEQISNNLNLIKNRQAKKSEKQEPVFKTLDNNNNFYSTESLNSIGSNNSSLINSSNDHNVTTSSLTSVSTSRSSSSNFHRKRVIVTEKLKSSSVYPDYNNINKLLAYSTSNMNETKQSFTTSINIHKSDQELNEDFSILEQNNSYIDYKELTEDDIEFLMDNTGFNCDQIRRWHVEFLNKCSTGLIKFEQFKAYYKMLLPSYLAEESKDEIVLRLFQLFDIDADGSLNFTEFLISFWIRCKAPIREKFTWVFNMLDMDRNGYLNYQEIKNALSWCLNVDTLNELLDQLNKEILVKNQTSNGNNAYSDFNHFDDTSFIESNSRSTTEEKLHQVIILLNLLGQNNRKKTFKEVKHEKDLFLNSMVLFKDLNLDKNNSQAKFSTNLEENECLKSTINKIQITRENFIDLTEKFKLLRKLVLPINNFYEGTFNE